MRMVLLMLLISFSALAKPLVLVSYFDPFDKAPFNNSQKVAQLLEHHFKNDPDIELRFCKLQTVFDKSFYELEDCLKSLPDAPALVLGLGESNCNFKIETMARNLDKTKGPDNDGVERNKTPIISGGPGAIGLKYALPEMYCSLPKKDRGDIEVSNDAGTFVCNNMMYQMSYHYQDINFGFIHVPANNCRKLEAKTQKSVELLTAMIKAAVKIPTPARLSITKKEIIALKEINKNNGCLEEFYDRTKAVDEKGFWSFLESK